MAARKRGKAGRTKAEKDRDKAAFAQLRKLIGNLQGDSGKAFMKEEILPQLMEWLEGLREEKGKVCLDDYVDTKR